MHPFVHTCLGLVLYISFQSPQYQFDQCLPKEILDKFCTNYATMELGLFQPSWEKQVCKTEVISAKKPCSGFLQTTRNLGFFSEKSKFVEN